MSARIGKVPMHRLSLAVAAFILVPILFTLPAKAEEAPREYIYGAELMTPKERDAYRQGLQQAPTDEARGQYRQRHRQQLQKRAQQRGKQLDEKGIVRDPGGER